MTRPAVIFDGDDTLWDTMPTYAAAKARFAAFLDKIGIPRTDAISKLDEIDACNVAAMGFSRTRFPTSMVETYRHFCSIRGLPSDRNHEIAAYNIGDSVFSTPCPGFPEARGVLADLAPIALLALATKGDPEVQERRIQQSGLADLFARVYILPTKSPGDFARITNDLGVQPRQAWSVGDSVRSDIRPALESGLSAIWIPRATWPYEEHECPQSRNLTVCDDLRCVPEVLQQAALGLTR